MLVNSKNVCSNKDDFENEVIIEKWLKHNSSNSVTIDQKNCLPINSDKKINGAVKIKRLHEVLVNKTELNREKEKELGISKTKLIKESFATKNNERQPLAKAISTKIVGRKSDSELKVKTVIPSISNTLSTSLQECQNKSNQKEATKSNESIVSVTQCNASEKIPSSTDSKNLEDNSNSRESIRNLLCKEKDADVYISLLDNYRYLITPKSWSVTELLNEKNDRCIVFFNVQVLKEDEILISVIRKSLIIDKGAAMNYSVHGLPVNIKGTILPKILDNTKKLLSILHIFDKMQVCDGVGKDLKIIQTDFVIKDSCRYWRHKNCKIILIKANRCSVCTAARNLLLETKIF